MPLKIVTHFAFYDILGAKKCKKMQKKIKYGCFLRLGSPKPRHLLFLTFSSKNHGMYHVFVPVPSKNTGIYAVFTILQDVVSICEKDKNIVFYDVFASRAQQKKMSTDCSKMTQNQLQKASYNSFIFFPGPGGPFEGKGS